MRKELQEMTLCPFSNLVNSALFLLIFLFICKLAKRKNGKYAST